MMGVAASGVSARYAGVGLIHVGGTSTNKP